MGPRRDTPGHNLAPPMTGMGAAAPLTTAVGQPEASERPTRVVSRTAPAPAASAASVGASWSVPRPEKPPPLAPRQLLGGRWTAPLPSAMAGAAMLGGGHPGVPHAFPRCPVCHGLKSHRRGRAPTIAPTDTRVKSHESWLLVDAGVLARLYPIDERATPINDFCRCL
jgi:hypothetical protein